MIAAATSSLVAGARPAPQKVIRVRVLRAFLHKGKRVEPGAELDLPRSLGMELVTGNKAEVVVEAASAAPAPAAAETETKQAKAAKSQGKQP